MTYSLVNARGRVASHKSLEDALDAMHRTPARLQIEGRAGVVHAATKGERIALITRAARAAWRRAGLPPDRIWQDEPLSRKLEVRVTESELGRIDQAASEAETTKSNLVRRKLGLRER